MSILFPLFSEIQDPPMGTPHCLCSLHLWIVAWLTTQLWKQQSEDQPKMDDEDI